MITTRDIGSVVKKNITLMINLKISISIEISIYLNLLNSPAFNRYMFNYPAKPATLGPRVIGVNQPPVVLSRVPQYCWSSLFSLFSPLFHVPGHFGLFFDWHNSTRKGNTTHHLLSHYYILLLVIPENILPLPPQF
jgi:hypothetical protein